MAWYILYSKVEGTKKRAALRKIKPLKLVSGYGFAEGPLATLKDVSHRLDAMGVREGQKISGNAAFGFWLKEIETAGFPKNRKTASLSCFIGTQFQSHGLVPPGQNMEGAARKAVLVAKQVVKLPGDAVAATAAIPVGMPTPPMSVPQAPVTPPQAPVTPPSSNGTVPSPLDIVSIVAAANNGNFTLQQVMAEVMIVYATEPNRDAMAGSVFTPEFTQQLLGSGYTVEGHQVTKV